MQNVKWSLIFLLTIIFFSCGDSQSTENLAIEPKDTTRIFPVTDFILGQLNEIDSLPVSPKRKTTLAGVSDSVWIKREEVRGLAQPFLSPVIDSAQLDKYFSGSTFLDQTINALTLNFIANEKIPKENPLRKFIVYINPQSGNVERIYLVKESLGLQGDTTRQLTWNAGKNFTIVTILQKKDGSAPLVQTEEVKWSYY